jgi:hypothetical protein
VVEVGLSGFGDAATREHTLDPGDVLTDCLSPALDFSALVRLHAPSRQVINASAREVGAEAPFEVFSLSVEVLPTNAMLWRAWDEAFSIFLATMVVSQHPALRRLQDDVERHSVRDGGFGVGGYDPPATPRRASIDPVEDAFCRGENVIVADGESIAVEVQVDRGDTFDVRIQDSAQRIIAQNAAAGTGARIATGRLDAGIYTIFFCNISGGPHAVTYRRNWLQRDVANDYLTAIFEFARAQGLSYANLTASDFTDAQIIRRPDEAVDGMGANCVEGALLFASFLEMFGVEPVLIVSLTNGHAFVGLWTSRDHDQIIPIETTFVGSHDVSAADAISYGIDEFNCWIGANDAACDALGQRQDPNVKLLDVRALRTLGIEQQPL